MALPVSQESARCQFCNHVCSDLKNLREHLVTACGSCAHNNRWPWMQAYAKTLKEDHPNQDMSIAALSAELLDKIGYYEKDPASMPMPPRLTHCPFCQTHEPDMDALRSHLSQICTTAALKRFTVWRDAYAGTLQTEPPLQRLKIAAQAQIAALLEADPPQLQARADSSLAVRKGQAYSVTPEAEMRQSAEESDDAFDAEDKDSSESGSGGQQAAGETKTASDAGSKKSVKCPFCSNVLAHRESFKNHLKGTCARHAANPLWSEAYQRHMLCNQSDSALAARYTREAKENCLKSLREFGHVDSSTKRAGWPKRRREMRLPSLDRVREKAVERHSKAQSVGAASSSAFELNSLFDETDETTVPSPSSHALLDHMTSHCIVLWYAWYLATKIPLSILMSAELADDMPNRFDRVTEQVKAGLVELRSRGKIPEKALKVMTQAFTGAQFQCAIERLRANEHNLQDFLTRQLDQWQGIILAWMQHVQRLWIVMAARVLEDARARAWPDEDGKPVAWSGNGLALLNEEPTHRAFLVRKLMGHWTFWQDSFLNMQFFLQAS